MFASFKILIHIMPVTDDDGILLILAKDRKILRYLIHNYLFYTYILPYIYFIFIYRAKSVLNIAKFIIVHGMLLRNILMK